jgi:hypothetical protein
MLYEELKVGDTGERVEAVLRATGYPYGYDRFERRYQSTASDKRCNPYKAVSISVYMDSSGKLSKIVTFDSYTGL